MLLLSVAIERGVTLTLMTDQQSQQRINEAAEKFTDALVQSYKTVAERGASAQERSTQLIEVLFNQTINNLHAQAKETEQATKGEKDARRRATGRIPEGEISMADISQFVDKDYEQKEFNELAE